MTALPPHPPTTGLQARVRLGRDYAATWTGEPHHESEVAGFDALHRAVVIAKRIRMLWGVALLIAILGVAAPTAIDFYNRAFGG